MLLQHPNLSSCKGNQQKKPAVWSSLELTWLQMSATISIDTCFLVQVTAY